MEYLDTEGVSKEISEFFSTAKSPALFAGAGVGAKAGLPTWPELMEHLAKVTEQHGELETAELIRIRYKSGHYLNAATIYKSCPTIPIGEIHSQIANQFSNPPNTKDLNALLSLPFSAVFTTNYDRSLLDSYSEVVRRAPKTVELRDPTMRMALFDQNFYIARLHGRAELPNSMILDEADYRELLSYQDYIDLLIHIFSDYECLFLGFSFADPAIAHVFEVIEKRFSPNFPKMHCALLPKDADDKFVRKLTEYNIKVIFYESSYGHFALWEGIKISSRKIPNDIKREKPKPEFPLKPIQRFLATSYSQLKMSKVLQPLRDVVIDGMILTLLRESSTRSIKVDSALEGLHGLLKLPVSDCELILKQRIEFLINEGAITEKDENLYITSNNNTHDLTDDIKILVLGVENRILVRQNGRIFSRFARCCI